MKSMTGYAKVGATLGDRNVEIEIKTLNSKQLDLIVKLPSVFRSRELDIRNQLTSLERGKIEFVITDGKRAEVSGLNAELLKSRYQDLLSVATSLDLTADISLFTRLAAMPDCWASDTSAECSDEEWRQLSAAISEAIGKVDAFRSHEGAVLEADFAKHVDLIETMLGRIPQYESERIDTAKDRIRKWMAAAEVKDVDENRFEQELIYYLEKLDITEEKVRLQKHIDYFRDTVRSEPTCGKKLGFVAQEMGREINTIGSKANHVEIQRLVVAMKDELEKIKEQLGNVL